MRYLGRRLGHAVLLLIGVSILTFLFAELAPGDVLDEMRMDPRISEATIQAVRDALRNGSVASAEIRAVAAVGRTR